MSDEKKTPGWHKRLDKTRLALWRRLSPQFAPEFLRDLYLGILGREPDAAGQALYLGKGKGMGDPIAVVTDLISSGEFKRRSASLAAPDLARTLLAGLHGADAVPEAELQALTEQLGQRENQAAAVGELLASEDWQRRMFNRVAPELARNLYRVVFGREPDPEGLENTLARFKRQDKLEHILGTMLESDEAKALSLARIAPELARVIHRAVLGREPDEAALQALTAKLSQKTSIEGAVAGLISSHEYQQKSVGSLSGALVDAAYHGLLGHAPDAEGRKRAEEKLVQGGPLSDLLSELTKSDEFKRSHFAAYASEMAHSFYRAILGRDADPKGLETYTQRLSAQENVQPALNDMIKSEEFRRAFMNPKPVPHPRLSYDNPCWVFLHIEKTAGTAIQNLLGASYNHKQLLREHDDTLYRRSVGELSQYTVLAGHFNHDSVAFIPKRRVSIFTFIREPYSRLYSLYHFLRAHEKGHPSFAPPMRLANELGMADFYKHEIIRRTHNHWNHMSWVVMGQRQWEDWRRQSKRAEEAPFSDAFMNEIARPAISRRLREFVLVGLQEDFDRSVDTLFRLLNKPRPETLRGDHSLETLMESSAHFKRHIDKEPLTEEVKAIMDQLCQLDRVLYDEAKILFQERLAESPSSETGSMPVNAEPPPAAQAKPAKRKSPAAASGKKKAPALPQSE